MDRQQQRFTGFTGFMGCAAVAMLAAMASTPALAGLMDGYAMQGLPVNVEGQFTAHNGQLHYWTATNGYQVYDVASGTTNTIGLPPNGVYSNGFGDAFGVLDQDNDIFYAATVYGASDSDVYAYDRQTGSWITPGQNGVSMVNAYGGQVHDGQLYVSGLAEPWNGGYGQSTFIFAYDHTATPDTEARHDTLIETAGNSAYLSVTPNGDVYYGTFSTNTLYRWTADQVASVTEDLYAPGAVDSFLTLSDATESWTLPGASNGLAVDAAGNVFFSVNNFASSPNHTLAMLDASQPDGYREIYTTDGFMDWFGPISVEGDFLNGGTLYFSPTTFGGDSMLAITVVPEPSALALFGLGGLLIWRRRRSTSGQYALAAMRSKAFRRTYRALPVLMLVILISGTAMAGEFSPGKGGVDEAAFTDAGIAGYVGPGGEGISPEDAPNNYVNPIFTGWATGYTLYDPSDELGPYQMNGIGRPPQFGIDFGDPTKTLGEVTGSNMDIVSLGDMDAAEIAAHLANPSVNPLGTLILTFDQAIMNGAGADFAAFENGFVSNYNTGAGSAAGQMFAELGYVEVSTDGVNYARFPSEYLNYLDGGPSSQAYLTQDVSNIYNLVGKHANAYGESWGTPFDLDDLVDDQMVLDGLVDLGEINFVKIVDIPGDGTFKDSQGNAIYDAWVTWGSGGLDFEALGIINQVPEPASLVMLSAGLAVLVLRRR